VALTDRRLTAEEYLARPPEDRFTQLVDGEIIVTEAALRHQRIVVELVYWLTTWCRAASGRGEAGVSANVFLDEGNVFAPDVWWVAEEHRPATNALGLHGPPDLAVEVRSPSTWRHDVGAKKTTYERHGLPELWLVDTESETVLVYRRSSPTTADFDVALELGASEALTSPLLPGFALVVEEIFAR
jgi:Uma2 family endonuclease